MLSFWPTIILNESCSYLKRSVYAKVRSIFVYTISHTHYITLSFSHTLTHTPQCAEK